MAGGHTTQSPNKGPWIMDYGFSLINFTGLPHHTAQGIRGRGWWLVELLTATRKD